jgi:hypothetical protein
VYFTRQSLKVGLVLVLCNYLSLAHPLGIFLKHNTIGISVMKFSMPLLLISTLSFASIAQAETFSISDLGSGVLNDISLYSGAGITLGANTNAGGNMQGPNPITIGVGSVVGGNLEAGTAITTGADSTVEGYLQAGTTITTGVNSIVEGHAICGTTITAGYDSQINGMAEAGETFIPSIGSNTPIGYSEGLALIPGYTAPVVENKKAQLEQVQKNLLALGKTGYTSLPITFGTDSMTLRPGIYDSGDYLTIRAGMTLTLDGSNPNGGESVPTVFVFNIHNYLAFAAGAQVVLNNVHRDSRVIWNVLGDVVGTSGNMVAAADVTIRGFIIARGFIETGADTDIFGIGQSCGGAVAVSNYIGLGARSTIGVKDCDSTFSSSTETEGDGTPTADETPTANDNEMGDNGMDENEMDENTTTGG